MIRICLKSPWVYEIDEVTGYNYKVPQVSDFYNIGYETLSDNEIEEERELCVVVDETTRQSILADNDYTILHEEII